MSMALVTTKHLQIFGVWSSLWVHVSVRESCCCQGYGELGVLWCHPVPCWHVDPSCCHGLLLSPWPYSSSGSVLMLVAPVIMGSHADAWGLGYNMAPYWCLRAMLLQGHTYQGGLFYQLWPWYRLPCLLLRAMSGSLGHAVDLACVDFNRVLYYGGWERAQESWS